MANDALITALSQLISEGRNPDTMDIDLLSSKAIVNRLNEQDKKVPFEVEKVLPQISQAVDEITKAFNNNGRLIYCGAGSSGRLGVLDAVECPPTFGVSKEMVIGLIAGGEKAMFEAQEGAEDSFSLGKIDLQTIQLTRNDIVVGIAASGRTPYVIGAIEYANQLGAKTVAVSCNSESTIAQKATISISPIVGPEALTGSTRLKSGTAQKLILNMLTTASMIRIGKSYENLMVDVKSNNKKLQARAIRIVMQATECDNTQAEYLLEQSQNNVKTAILMELIDVSYIEATERLSKSGGFLRKAVQQSNC